MRVHYLQHVAFEGPGSILSVLENRGHQISATRFFKGELPPPVTAVDWIVIMGGPMSVKDEESYPWLPAEKAFIREAIRSGKIVLGICLGAQLIAEALGSCIRKNEYREIGWFDIKRSPGVEKTLLKGLIPDKVKVFHWHGETFDLPAGAISLAESEACENQGFIFGNHVVGLQFHLEVTPESAAALVASCWHELDGSRYVQSGEEILVDDGRFRTVNQLMNCLLDKLESGI